MGSCSFTVLPELKPKLSHGIDGWKRIVNGVIFLVYSKQYIVNFYYDKTAKLLSPKRTELETVESFPYSRRTSPQENLNELAVIQSEFSKTWRYAYPIIRQTVISFDEMGKVNPHTGVCLKV
ncbi:hypothetical protein ACJX0J_010107 [Zea mays]